VALPRPLAADGKVIVDSAARTLIVNPAKAGYASLLWREAHQELAKAEDAGRYSNTVWAHGASINKPAAISSSPRRDPPANQLPAMIPAHSVRMSSRPCATSRR